MNKIERFIELLSTQIDKGIYVWGGDGENMLHLSCELEAVKESTKSAHKRIDRLEENRIGVEHHE